MIDISVKGLVKAFEAENNILNGLSLEIGAGEHVALLGKNGAGKTTLFRLITGEIAPDEGIIVTAPGKRIGLISQIPAYPETYTTEDVLMAAHSRLYAMEENMRQLTQRMAESHDAYILKEYDTLAATFTRLGGYSMELERNRVANGLDIPEAMRAQLFSMLSGGERTRVNLARLILEDTDILLLDEPTNHLDMKSTEWLEDYIEKFRGTVLLISHDRYFLDRTAQRTIEISDGKAAFYSGNYSFYVTEKQRRFDEQLTKYQKEQKEIRRLEESARRLYQWGTGNRHLMKKSAAVRTRIERMEKTDKPKADKKLVTRFSQREFSGDEVLVIEGLKKSFGDKTILAGADLLVEGGERIALIGSNGTGKTTLLKMITGEARPDAGFIGLGPAVKTALLPQIIEFSDPRRTVLDTLLYEGAYTPQNARNRLGAFHFFGEDVFKPVSALSGGERSRLRLCMLMKEDINFLILDEPTNHLDIPSREWMEEALSDYNEALLFVSHDRYFIERFATRIWELDGGAVTDFRGGFDEYREYKRRQAQYEAAAKAEGKKKERKKKAPQSPAKQQNKLEREIGDLESEITGLDAQIQANASDYQMLLDLGEKREAAEETLLALYEKWDELSSYET